MVADRWRPVRAGIRNIWEYDDQVFDFADGRLILRGPNGSGKSNALALLFPFLIDGVMSAAAMDPFAGGRSMRSLLLGVLRDDADARRFRHDNRLGYVWLELARPTEPEPGPGTDPGCGVDPDTGLRHVTIGCGARASANAADVRAWFFVTPMRVGHDLHLDTAGELLTRSQLAEVVGSEAVFTSAEAYRAAVDRALYGMGPERHRKLVSLIRVLRRPQLAGKLDLELLSQVLSSGLPSLSETVLDEVASSLDDLESTQRELADLQAARATVEAFLPTYAAYLRGEALRRAHAVTAVHHAGRRAEARLAAARTSLAEVAEALQANESARHATDLERSAVDAERVAVIESPAFRDASSLQEVERNASRAEAARDDAADRRDQARQRADEAATGADRADREAEGAHADAERVLTGLLDVVDAGGLGWTLGAADARDPDRLEVAAQAAARGRRADLREVRGALRDRDDAHRDHERAEAAASRALQAADEAAAAVATAETSVGELRSDLAERIGRWAAAAPGLDDAGRAELVASVDTVGEPGDSGPAARYRELVAPERDRLVEARTGVERDLADQRSDHAARTAERDRVATAVDPGPPVPAWRAVPTDAPGSAAAPGPAETGGGAGRAGRSGAPLWACCDFADSVPEADRVGLEAALEAAGLLDAWIAPDPTPASDAVPASDGVPADGAGGPEDGDRANDAWLDPATAPAPAEPGAATLAAVLVPSVPEGSGLSEDRIRAVLGAIGLGRAGIAVDLSGRFALGPLVGRHRKTQADYIGATARAERRRRRMAELDAQIAALGAEIAGVEAGLAGIKGSLAALAAAPSTLPSSTDLERALARLGDLRNRAGLRAEAAQEARDAEARAAERVARAVTELTRLAAERHLPAEAEGLDRIDQLVGRVERDAVTATQARRHAHRSAAEAATARQSAERAADDLRRRGLECEQADRDAVAERARASALRDRLGPDAEAPLVALRRCEARLGELAAERERLDQDRADLSHREGEVQGEARSAEAAVSSARSELDAASARSAVLRRADLVAVFVPQQHRPGPDHELPPDPVGFAVWLADRVPGPAPDDRDQERRVAALDRAQKGLLDDLHQGYDPSIAHDDGITTIQVSSERGTFGLAVVADELARQVEQLQTYLTEGDREVFERFLLNRVAHELRTLLADAEEFVAGVNAALAAAPTASGLRVELAWELADADDNVQAAVRLLRRDTEQMGDVERAELRGFFERVIRQHRADDPTRGYRAVLETALDHRSWHRFQPHLRNPDGSRTRLTRTRFRELSGGEQAVALHLPLFAAAAAHYARARPGAPRLVALDEAFAGIDEAMRGELMGLTVRFDLDLIMTGHELWGTYAEVPAVAVHDLLRRPPAEGVSVFSLRWDGTTLSEGAAASPAGAAAAAAPGGLFEADRADAGSM